jgi:hypothetical protein
MSFSSLRNILSLQKGPWQILLVMAMYDNDII